MILSQKFIKTLFVHRGSSSQSHYHALTKDVNGPIRQYHGSPSYFVLPGVPTEARVFPLALNKLGQPTILAGEFGKVSET